MDESDFVNMISRALDAATENMSKGAVEVFKEQCSEAAKQQLAEGLVPIDELRGLLNMILGQAVVEMPTVIAQFCTVSMLQEAATKVEGKATMLLLEQITT